MSKTNTTTPTRSIDHSSEPTAPDYAVPDPIEAWERFDRFVGKVLETPREKLLPANNDMKEQTQQPSSLVVPK